MKDNLVLIICLIVYTITFFWFGLWVQTRLDQRQLKKWTIKAWTEGCNICAEFEKKSCERDQLQGITEHPKIK